MAQLPQLTRPVVGTGTRFHPNQTGGKPSKEGPHVPARELLSYDHFVVVVYPVYLKNMFCQINTDTPNFHHRSPSL
jgi:hypothetical protein